MNRRDYSDEIPIDHSFEGRACIQENTRNNFERHLQTCRLPRNNVCDGVNDCLEGEIKILKPNLNSNIFFFCLQA